MVRKPADPEEELRWMAQEVRGYVEAVLNSLAANVPKVINQSSSTSTSIVSLICLAISSFFFFFFLVFVQAVVLCQVEKAKEDMLNKLYSSIRLAPLFATSYIIVCLTTI